MNWMETVANWLEDIVANVQPYVDRILFYPQDIFTFGGDEVYIDGGCYTGDTMSSSLIASAVNLIGSLVSNRTHQISQHWLSVSVPTPAFSSNCVDDIETRARFGSQVRTIGQQACRTLATSRWKCPQSIWYLAAIALRSSS